MYERIAPLQHDSLDGVPEPSETLRLFGHETQAGQMVAAYQGGKLPHGLILAGPRGIGKATFAFQLALHLLAHPKPASAPIRLEQRDAASALYRQVASGAHPSVLHLTRPFNEKTKSFKTMLTVDEIRRIGRFLSLTAHDGGYRVAIVDAADDLNVNAANALLKNLEEPPSRTMFILIAHRPGRLLPTIRSRCQVLRLQPLAEPELIAALSAFDKTPAPEQASTLVARAAGSVRAAVLLTDYGGVEITDALDKLAGMGNPPAAEAHRLAEAVSGRDQQIQFGILNEHALDLLAHAATEAAGRGDGRAADRISEAWQELRIAILDVETYNLDRKQHVLGMIARLNDTFRM